MSDAKAHPQAIPFWASASIDEIATRQGVTGPTDMDAVADLFDSDEDVDEFLDSIRGTGEGR